MVRSYSSGHLPAPAVHAAQVLHEMPLGPAAPASTRFSAASLILEQASKSAELDTVTTRMAEIDRTVLEMHEMVTGLAWLRRPIDRAEKERGRTR